MTRQYVNSRQISVINDDVLVSSSTWFVLYCLWRFGDQDIAADSGIVFG